MSKLPLILTAGLVLLVACNSPRTPNAENFTKAINQYLEEHGRACTPISRPFPIDIPASASQSQYGFGPQLTALQQAGLVSETNTTAAVHSMLDAVRGTTPPQPVRRYQLTAEGQNYLQQVPGTFGPTNGFCYGQKTVASILNWSSPVSMGDSLETEVNYTYKIVNLAPWARLPAIQQAFPDVGATVSGASKATQKITLRTTSAGWKASGS